MVANRIRSCPELSNYILIEKQNIKKSCSFDEIIKLHKYTSNSIQNHMVHFYKIILTQLEYKE